MIGWWRRRWARREAFVHFPFQLECATPGVTWTPLYTFGSSSAPVAVTVGSDWYDPGWLCWARRREHELRRVRMRAAGMGGVIAPGLR